MRTFAQFIREVFDQPQGENLPPDFQTGLHPGSQQMTWDKRTQTPKIDEDTMMKIVGMSIVKGMNSAAITQALGGIYSQRNISRNLERYGLTRETRRMIRQVAEERVGISSQGRSSKYPWTDWQDEGESETGSPMPGAGDYPMSGPTPAAPAQPRTAARPEEGPVPPPPSSQLWPSFEPVGSRPLTAQSSKPWQMPKPVKKPRTPEQERRHQQYLASKGIPRIPDDQIDPTDWRRMVAKERRDFAKKFGVPADSLEGNQIVKYYGGGQQQEDGQPIWRSLRVGIQKALADQNVNIPEIVARAKEDVRKWKAQRSVI